jgi:hypothetical protein
MLCDRSYLLPDVISVITLPLLFVDATHVVRAVTCALMLLRFSKLPSFLTDNLLGNGTIPTLTTQPLFNPFLVLLMI